MSTSVRATSDAQLKQFKTARANIVRLLQKMGVENPRQCEREIYRRSHTSLSGYQHGAESVVRRLRLGGDPFPPSKQRSVRTKNQVSQAELSALFDVDLSDVVKEEKRFALTRCGVCKSQEVSVVQAQLRSGDEAMSMLATCKRCGHNWRQD